MITATGFSKDPAIMAEGIAVTWGVEMLQEKGIRPFIKYFEQCMAGEDNFWMHWVPRAPTRDIVYVYIVVLNRLLYRCYYAGFETGLTEMHNADGSSQVIDRPRILLAGPFVKCPFKRELRGFRSFRYTTKLF